jgi:hypothetical protein
VPLRPAAAARGGPRRARGSIGPTAPTGEAPDAAEHGDQQGQHDRQCPDPQQHVAHGPAIRRPASEAAKAISSATRMGTERPRSTRAEYCTGRTYTHQARLRPCRSTTVPVPVSITRCHGVRLGGRSTILSFEAASTWPSRSKRRIRSIPRCPSVKSSRSPGELGVRPTAQGQGVLDRDLDRSRHAGGTRLLVGHPRARFLLHTEHTVDTAHEQERQHEEQDEAKSKPHGLRANDSVRYRREQSRWCAARGLRVAALAPTTCRHRDNVVVRECFARSATFQRILPHHAEAIRWPPLHVATTQPVRLLRFLPRPGGERL